jgi:hypothetical protein
MTDPSYGQPDIPPPVDPWATGELRSDPTTSSPTPLTVPQQPMPPAEPPPLRGVATVPEPPQISEGWDPVPYGGGGGGGMGRRVVLIAAVAVLAVVVGSFAFVLTGSRNWFAPQTATTTNNNTTTTTTPPASPTCAPSGGPFDGTPAQCYPKGDAGIVLQAPSDITGFTSAQVNQWLQKVKLALTAARLDPKMLNDHDTSVLLDLLAPDDSKSIDKQFAKHQFLGFATQLGPGQHLSADPVRVKGAVTFTAAVNDAGVHQLKIDSNFVWVYGFDGPSTQPGQRIVTIHDQVTWYVHADTEVAPTSQGLYLSSWHAYTYNMDCTLVKDDLIGLGQPSTVSGASPGPSIDLNQLLDPKSTVDIGANTC